jgi:hypothetical protein
MHKAAPVLHNNRWASRWHHPYIVKQNIFLWY